MAFAALRRRLPFALGPRTHRAPLDVPPYVLKFAEITPATLLVGTKELPSNLLNAVFDATTPPSRVRALVEAMAEESLKVDKPEAGMPWYLALSAAAHELERRERGLATAGVSLVWWRAVRVALQSNLLVEIRVAMQEALRAGPPGPEVLTEMRLWRFTAGDALAAIEQVVTPIQGKEAEELRRVFQGTREGTINVR